EIEVNWAFGWPPGPVLPPPSASIMSCADWVRDEASAASSGHTCALIWLWKAFNLLIAWTELFRRMAASADSNLARSGLGRATLALTMYSSRRTASAGASTSTVMELVLKRKPSDTTSKMRWAPNGKTLTAT